MRIGRNEIVEELACHMHGFGGEPGACVVGTAATDPKWQIPNSGAKAPEVQLEIQNSKENLSALPFQITNSEFKREHLNAGGDSGVSVAGVPRSSSALCRG
jgi:hypothetical protein